MFLDTVNGKLKQANSLIIKLRDIKQFQIPYSLFPSFLRCYEQQHYLTKIFSVQRKQYLAENCTFKLFMSTNGDNKAKIRTHTDQSILIPFSQEIGILGTYYYIN